MGKTSEDSTLITQDCASNSWGQKTKTRGRRRRLATVPRPWKRFCHLRNDSGCPLLPNQHTFSLAWLNQLPHRLSVRLNWKQHFRSSGNQKGTQRGLGKRGGGRYPLGYTLLLLFCIINTGGWTETCKGPEILLTNSGQQWQAIVLMHFHGISDIIQDTDIQGV